MVVVFSKGSFSLLLQVESNLSKLRSLKNEEENRASEAGAEVKPNPLVMSSVLASLNKMQVLRQRTMALRGNITPKTPLRKFEPNAVREEMEKIVSSALKGVTYEPSRASVLSKSLSDTIKSKVKTMKYPRYKFISYVTICSQSNQCMFMGSRCLWNDVSDNHVTVNFRNDSLAAVATLFAIFHE